MNSSQNKLKFKRIVLVGHSFGGIFANVFTYYHPELIAGVSFNAVSNISANLGFLAYTASSYGTVAEMCNRDWSKLKNINDIDFQLNFQKNARKEVSHFNQNWCSEKIFILQRKYLRKELWNTSTILFQMILMRQRCPFDIEELSLEMHLKYILKLNFRLDIDFQKF